MPRRKHVAKALAYITQGDKLLVFSKPEAPEAGIQIPGGGVERAEALEAAALREAREETGLGELVVRSYLGSAEYELMVDTGPPHLRHFFHLECVGPAPERWRHVEPRSAQATPRVFDLWWEPIGSARLAWKMDHYLEALREKLARAGTL